MGRKYQRQNGENMLAFQQRCQEAEQLEKAARAVPKKPRHRSVRVRYTAQQRNADKVDGYDRDNLGESPDY